MHSGLPPITAIRHELHHLRDPDEFSVAISGGNLIADFLGAQERPTIIEQFQTPLWALDFQEAHVKAHVHCPIPPGWASVGFMRSPAGSIWHGFEASQGTLMCDPPGQAIDGCFTPGFSCLAISVPTLIWERCRAIAGCGDGEFTKAVAVRLPPPVLAHLESRAREVRASLRSGSPLAAAETTALVTEMFTTAWELSTGIAPPRSSHRNRTRLAQRAEEWMRAHLTEPVQVPEVCLALGVSRRELEYAFRLTFDQSPRDFLQALRLNAIRRSLKYAGPDVSLMDLAFDHGLMHLGRFAAQYRALFGENPSAWKKRGTLLR